MAAVGTAQVKEVVRLDAAQQECIELVFDELRHAGTGGILRLGEEGLACCCTRRYSVLCTGRWRS